jgi:hypothetical protein
MLHDPTHATGVFLATPYDDDVEAIVGAAAWPTDGVHGRLSDNGRLECQHAAH